MVAQGLFQMLTFYFADRTQGEMLSSLPKSLLILLRGKTLVTLCQIIHSFYVSKHFNLWNIADLVTAMLGKNSKVYNRITTQSKLLPYLTLIAFVTHKSRRRYCGN